MYSHIHGLARDLLPNGRVGRYETRPLYTLLLKCEVGNQVSNCCEQKLRGDPNGSEDPTYTLLVGWWVIFFLVLIPRNS